MPAAVRAMRFFVVAALCLRLATSVNAVPPSSASKAPQSESYRVPLAGSPRRPRQLRATRFLVALVFWACLAIPVNAVLAPSVSMCNDSKPARKAPASHEFVAATHACSLHCSCLMELYGRPGVPSLTERSMYLRATLAIRYICRG